MALKAQNETQNATRNGTVGAKPSTEEAPKGLPFEFPSRQVLLPVLAAARQDFQAKYNLTGEE